MASIRETSPFSALTYQEQQDRWLEWRSRQLDYQPAAAPERIHSDALPPIQVPIPNKAAHMGSSYRHAQLDQLYSRHKAASQKAVNWQTPTSVVTGSSVVQ